MTGDPHLVGELREALAEAEAIRDRTGAAYARGRADALRYALSLLDAEGGES